MSDNKPNRLTISVFEHNGGWGASVSLYNGTECLGGIGTALDNFEPDLDVAVHDATRFLYAFQDYLSGEKEWGEPSDGTTTLPQSRLR